MTEGQKRTCQEILARHGELEQSLVACEEAGEFIQAVSKCHRKKDDTHAVQLLISEIADIEIMMEQLKAQYAIMDSEVNDEIERKLKIRREYEQ